MKIEITTEISHETHEVTKYFFRGPANIFHCPVCRTKKVHIPVEDARRILSATIGAVSADEIVPYHVNNVGGGSMQICSGSEIFNTSLGEKTKKE